MKGLLIMAFDGITVAALTQELKNTLAVSYTHLDVYKRQLLWCAPADTMCKT